MSCPLYQFNPLETLSASIPQRSIPDLPASAMPGAVFGSAQPSSTFSFFAERSVAPGIGIELVLGNAGHLEMCLIELLSAGMRLRIASVGLTAPCALSVWNAQQDQPAEHIRPQDRGVCEPLAPPSRGRQSPPVYSRAMDQLNRVVNQLKLRVILDGPRTFTWMTR
jgi:hypothetical protein